MKIGESITIRCVKWEPEPQVVTMDMIPFFERCLGYVSEEGYMSCLSVWQQNRGTVYVLRGDGEWEEVLCKPSSVIVRERMNGQPLPPKQYTTAAELPDGVEFETQSGKKLCRFGDVAYHATGIAFSEVVGKPRGFTAPKTTGRRYIIERSEQ